MEKHTEEICLKKTNKKKKKYMKECRKNQSSNVLKKTKENNKLKSVEVDLVTKIIKAGLDR